MSDQILQFVASHQSIGALVYSWGSFEIGRTYRRMGRDKGAFLWGGMGALAAVIYFFVAVFLVQWMGAILLGVTAGLQLWLMKRWFEAGPQVPDGNN